jgi:predicted aspartyl protease
MGMGHVFVDVVVKGSRGEEKLEKVMVDSGASYTVLDLDIVERVSAWRIPYKISLELGDGRVVEAEVYAIIICVEGRCAPTLVTSFRGAKNVVGVRTLEDLGLAVDPVSKRLIPVRPSNTAYFYLLHAKAFSHCLLL